jgi:hypothetical protein
MICPGHSVQGAGGGVFLGNRRGSRSLYWKFIKSHNQGGYNTPQEFTATTKKKKSKKDQERGSRNKKTDKEN